VLLPLALAIGAPVGAAADNLPGTGKTVKTGIATDESRFALEVAKLALQRLGYQTPDTVTTSVQAGYVAVAQGDLDVWGEYWDPNHGPYLAKAGGTSVLKPVGVLVDGAFGAYLIDKKTADQYNIHDISQLKDPKIAALFDSDGDGRANFAGCPVGWGCDPIIAYQMKAYGLDKTVQNEQGDFVVTHSDVIARFKAGKPVFYYTYGPLWLNQVLVPGKDVVFLQVPFTALPPDIQPQPSTSLPDGRNIGFPLLKVRLVANDGFLAANPAAAKLFEVATVPLSAVEAENYKIYQGEKSYDQIKGHAADWVKANQSTVDGWVAEASKAAK
jgi:glycine betaine/proline transport system substrate-binding protein